MPERDPNESNAPRRSFQLRPEAGFAPAQVSWQTELNEEQRAAVFAKEPHVLVLAGAGTGKTRVITYRLAWLLQQGAELPTCFLATFTNQAAREMLHRVETLLQRPVQGLWGGTFHSLCARLLRREATTLGFSERFTILDSEDAAELMSEVRAQLLQNPTGQRFPQSPVLLALHSLAQNMGQHPAEVLAKRYPQFLELGDQILPILQGYTQRKRALNAMDYDDLLAHTVTLLTQHEQIARKWALHFRHLLVDEYQDTNHQQGVIVDRLASAGATLMVVGDDAQAIYAFRGADYRNILTFHERYRDCTTYKLQTNYRSTPPILNLANALFANAPEHFRKTLVPVKKGGYRPALVAARDAAEQASFIASRLLDLREEGRPLNQMGILVRSNANAMEIELELRKRRIPFRVRGGLRFLEQAHIKDVLAHLIVTVNGKDALSWQRLFKLQKKVGPKRALELWEAIGSAPDPYAAFLNPEGAAYGSLPQLRSLLGTLSRVPPAQAIAAVAESSYREVVYAKYTNPRQRIEDLEQLALFAEKHPDTTAFLDEIKMQGGLAAEDLIATDDPEEQVILSTIHQAKGMEWEVVFVPMVVEGIIPHWLALKEGGGEEERRLLYVAITRAREELYLVYPQMRYVRGTPILNQLSSFLSALPQGCVDEAIIESAAPPPVTVPQPESAVRQSALADVDLEEEVEEALDGPSAKSPYEE